MAESGDSRDGFFTNRVERGEDVNKDCHQGCLQALIWNEEAHPARQQCPAHVREGGKQEESSAEGVNGEHCRESLDC